MESLIGPFKEQLETYRAECKILEAEKDEVQQSTRELSLQYAASLGHQNKKQKIQYIAITHNPDDGLVQVAAQDLQTDSVYYSQSSQLPYNRPLTMNPSGGSTQQTTPQTPNTPSSIPDIILTDFSSNSGDGLVKELGSAISGTFDPDLFPSDETLREGLGSIDLEGLQMLTDPLNVITDPTTEDNFRMDRMDRL
ncbi:hypothetical protein R5R35_002055 [Gryllus longicercus]|uniref:Uncharacterized protein n=1 Tax=Gryllus longicercus TaxID=2509291 RepID=A0AAN9Z600_9ORTH